MNRYKNKTMLLLLSTSLYWPCPLAYKVLAWVMSKRRFWAEKLGF
jgi:hypothetical protein